MVIRIKLHIRGNFLHWRKISTLVEKLYTHEKVLLAV